MSKEQSSTSRDTSRISYSRPPNMKLPENYVICNGFLCKGTTPVTLVASGITESAAQGFLHLEEAEDYETG